LNRLVSPKSSSAFQTSYPQLAALDFELETCENEDDMKVIREQISSREDQLKPVYLLATTEFADLHDKTGRMQAKGVIKEAVPLEKSREFFSWRATRRMAEDDVSDRCVPLMPALQRTLQLSL
jgi:acetyl-CoA carboxylase/biotin carboxylase 1